MFIRGESASSKLRGKARRERTRITSQQLQRLEESYEENHYPRRDEVEELTEELDLKEMVIKNWFNNRRSREKI